MKLHLINLTLTLGLVMIMMRRMKRISWAQPYLQTARHTLPFYSKPIEN
jgi:hypothetical protein